jgi:hypothetical protein
MKDSWINHNTDKLLLFVLVLASGMLVMHMVHHQVDKDALTWAENSFSTVLGALILILTGRIQRADNQTANGAPPAPGYAPPPAVQSPAPPATAAAPAAPASASP